MCGEKKKVSFLYKRDLYYRFNSGLLVKYRALQCLCNKKKIEFPWNFIYVNILYSDKICTTKVFPDYILNSCEW